mmetsp:Transcript_39873/g.51386  ORF Transcript_39873/g.51386 Transcript_39873/m.51386 type:complete len:610 (+) Transcript_39873:100-1929(+)
MVDKGQDIVIIESSDSDSNDEVQVMETIPKQSMTSDGTSLCPDCGKHVPIHHLPIHLGRCKKVSKVNVDVVTHTTSRKKKFKEEDKSTTDVPIVEESSLSYLASLLPSWSKKHLKGLLKSNNNDVSQAYEAVSQLSIDDPDALPLSYRDAILLHSQEETNDIEENNHLSLNAPIQKKSRSSLDSHSSHSRSSSSSSSPPLTQSTSPYPCFRTHAFRLFQSLGVSQEQNHNCISLKSLIPNNKRLTSIVIFNMMIDWDCLVEEIPALGQLSGNQITIIHGEGMLNSARGLPHGVKLHSPPLPDYGSHHSKGMLCFFHPSSHSSSTSSCVDCGSSTCTIPSTAYLAVIITTANFIHSDLKLKTNGVWSTILPKKSSSSRSSSSSSTPLEFEEDLTRYFNHYNRRAKEVIFDPSCFKEYSFNHLRGVKLIASAPGCDRSKFGRDFGVHQGREAWHWGHLSLRQTTAKLQAKTRYQLGKVQSTHALCQFTSMGNISEKWLAGQFLDAMLGEQSTSLARYGASAKKPKNGWLSQVHARIEFVVPTVEDVRTSVEGYAAGVSIPLPSKNMDRDWVRPLFHRYGTKDEARNRSMPHIKTFCCYDTISSSSSSSSSR